MKDYSYVLWFISGQLMVIGVVLALILYEVAT